MSFADLHRPGHPFVLPNAWDVGTARALAAEGFPAIGTTSLGVAAGAGRRDAAGDTRELTRALATALAAAHLPCPVTCDIEDGYADDSEAVADFVASLPVDGVNLEDSTHGVLVDPARHAAKVAAVKRRTPDVFVNARVDTYWLGRCDLEETLDRGRRYVAAGADGIFVPGDLPAADIRSLTAGLDRPLNVLASSRLTAAELGELGVARISTGSLLYRVALTQALEAARAVRDGSPPPAALAYAEVVTLTAPSRP